MNPGLTSKPELVTQYNEAMDYIRPSLCLFKLHVPFGINTIKLPHGFPCPPQTTQSSHTAPSSEFAPSSELAGGLLPFTSYWQSYSITPSTTLCYHTLCQREDTFCFVVTPIYLQRKDIAVYKHLLWARCCARSFNYKMSWKKITSVSYCYSPFIFCAISQTML